MSPDSSAGGKHRAAWVAGGLAAAALLTYLPLLSAGFVNYDDPSYVTANPHVRGGLSLAGLKWAFTTFYFYNWLPLTWLSHMVDVEFFGLNAWGHHLVNLVLHLANTVLLFEFFRKATASLWKSAVVAALFALHPLHVESVAWVSERKDVLSTFFGFSLLLAYTGYARSRSPARYLLCLAFFALGLTAKSMLLSFPLVLLLVDHWPLSRGTTPFRELWLEKLPFALLAAVSAVVTYRAQRGGGAVVTGTLFTENAGVALLAYGRYAAKMVWPSGLAVFYPLHPGDAPGWQALAVFAALALVTGFALLWRKNRPPLIVGWLWYLITLAPVAGFLRLGQHALADRYTYVPLVGLFVALVWSGAELGRRLRVPTAVLAGGAALVLAACCVLTNAQARVWHTSETLFRHTLAVTDRNWLAHKNLAAALAGDGKFREALFHAGESLRLWKDPLEYVSQGWLYLQLRDFPRAAEACRNSLALKQEGNEKAYFLLGVASAKLGDRPTLSASYQALCEAGSPYAPRLASLQPADLDF